jgi:hypothetical protein
MSDYQLIESTLAAYFNASVGNSEAEAITLLRKSLTSNPAFRQEFSEELRQAFADNAVSWAELFSAHDAGYFEDEDRAKSYARRVLWETTFGP